MAVIQQGDIIAVDFDGTLCENAWPGIGSPNDDLITFLIKSREKGAQLILWTMREGELLEKALVWCRARGLGFDAVNDNVQKMKDFYGNNPRKVFANYYLDDHNLHVCWPEGYNCVMVGQEALALSYGRDWHEAKR